MGDSAPSSTVEREVGDSAARRLTIFFPVHGRAMPNSTSAELLFAVLIGNAARSTHSWGTGVGLKPGTMCACWRFMLLPQGIRKVERLSWSCWARSMPRFAPTQSPRRLGWPV